MTEYASLCWMGISTTTLQLLDHFQMKALQIIARTSDQEYADLKRLLPPPYQIRRMTYSSLSMPSHALEEPKYRTQSTGRSLTHVAVKMWNRLPDDYVGEINDKGAQSFKTQAPLTITDNISGQEFYIYNLS